MTVFISEDTLDFDDPAEGIVQFTKLQEARESQNEPSGETFTNSLGMTFNLIPAGTFMMGSPESEPGRRDDENQHQVSLTKPYYIQTTEVTQEQWKLVMGNNPAHFSDCGEDCPVESVSWNDVQAYITELNKLGDGGYRLPTEAEWEHMDPTGPASGTSRILRGGSWYYSSENCRSANRYYYFPGSRSSNRGFRLVLTEVP